MNKIKPSEIIILLLAIVIGGLAFFFQSTESAKHSEDKKTESNHLIDQTPPQEFFDHSSTVPHTELAVINPDDARQTVTTFFELFSSISGSQPTPTSYSNIKALLSAKINAELSEDPLIGTKELSRMVGLLTPPKSTNIIQVEQLSPDHIDITVRLTNETDASTTKIITLINENQNWKIETFSE